MSCDVDEVTERLENELRHFTYVTAHSPTLPLLHLRHSSFSNPSFASPTLQALHLIHLASRPWCVCAWERKRESIYSMYVIDVGIHFFLVWKCIGSFVYKEKNSANLIMGDTSRWWSISFHTRWSMFLWIVAGASLILFLRAKNGTQTWSSVNTYWQLKLTDMPSGGIKWSLWK